MKGNAPTLARGVLVMAGILGITAAAVLADALHLGVPLARLGAFDAAEARNLINAFSRAGNQLVAVVFTTVPSPSRSPPTCIRSSSSSSS